MCEYTKVEYACGHLRFTVRAWCIKYQESHKRCPANVVAVEYRLDERCGDCRDTSSMKWSLKRKSSTVAVQTNKRSTSSTTKSRK
ncbi:unnamed protein product [Zymoseptoria tritici ST99CH_1A5]|uniref:Uncharacterized protein n=2 Tax=Zymoseptoria tritici TaxID=1047171 RepID=A0A2H1G3Y9_ZYMTR|nr:unnamed protein product [Zymoseptoria tritici ST99CH_1E4]SMR49503.1 unnamed protein product [Zymoseptoria tritici ST99CH_3D1]SMY22201.1 unnamed protein product [Zymoseptoria tritici ST99CH_1A5]